MTELTKHEPHTIYIKPSKGLAALNLRDLWIYRELIFFMVWRDVKVKYKQTLLGMAWAVIQPLMTMLVFTFLFDKVAKLPTEGIPYPVFSFTALLPWGLFVTALNQGSRSLVAHPLFLLLAIVTALGVALWLSAINVQYRDVNQALPFLTQFWLFATPVAYSATVISAKWQVLYFLNPMAGVVNGFRWSLLGIGNGPDITLWVSTGISILIFVSGLFYFRSMEKTFADTI